MSIPASPGRVSHMRPHNTTFGPFVFLLCKLYGHSRVRIISAVLEIVYDTTEAQRRAALNQRCGLSLMTVQDARP